jgi:hypothetical protein
MVHQPFHLASFNRPGKVGSGLKVRGKQSVELDLNERFAGVVPEPGLQ